MTCLKAIITHLHIQLNNSSPGGRKAVGSCKFAEQKSKAEAVEGDHCQVCELKIIFPTEHGVVLQVTFNIIRFPSPHRATLFSLLSHLEKVTGYREVNRMAVANLAIVFGPTLVSFDYLDL